MPGMYVAVVTHKLNSMAVMLEVLDPTFGPERTRDFRLMHAEHYDGDTFINGQPWLHALDDKLVDMGYDRVEDWCRTDTGAVAEVQEY